METSILPCFAMVQLKFSLFDLLICCQFSLISNYKNFINNKINFDYNFEYKKYIKLKYNNFSVRNFDFVPLLKMIFHLSEFENSNLYFEPPCIINYLL